LIKLWRSIRHWPKNWLRCGIHHAAVEIENNTPM
jgi:hypothetical protein